MMTTDTAPAEHELVTEEILEVAYEAILEHPDHKWGPDYFELVSAAIRAVAPLIAAGVAARTDKQAAMLVDKEWRRALLAVAAEREACAARLEELASNTESHAEGQDAQDTMSLLSAANALRRGARDIRARGETT